MHSIDPKKDDLQRICACVFQAYVLDNKSRVANDPIGSDRYRLDIDLGTVTFLHHHFMNIEHVFAMKLKQMYEHYTVRCQQRIVQQLSDKVC